MRGFEELTKALTLEEKRVVPSLVQILKERTGKDKAITGSQIASTVYTATSYKLDGARLRKMINYIRLTGAIELLAASSAGYYIAADAKEAGEYQQSLRDRVVAIRETLTAFTKQCEARQLFQYQLFDKGVR